jgi:hypothetical protein
MAYSLSADLTATIPLWFTEAGHAIEGPSVGATVTSSDETVATVALSVDEQSIVITPVAASGTCTITYAGDGLTASLDVTIKTPEPDAVGFSVADAVLAPKAATTAPASSSSTSSSAPAAVPMAAVPIPPTAAAPTS